MLVQTVLPSVMFLDWSSKPCLHYHFFKHGPNCFSSLEFCYILLLAVKYITVSFHLPTDLFTCLPSTGQSSYVTSYLPYQQPSNLPNQQASYLPTYQQKYLPTYQSVDQSTYLPTYNVPTNQPT